MIILWEPSRGKNHVVICLALDKWSFGEVDRGRNRRGCWLEKGAKRGKFQRWKLTQRPCLSDLEDGAAPRPCHVSVRRRIADSPPQKQRDICDLAVDLPAFALRRRGWTLLPLRSDHHVKCGKCAVGVDQLHSGYSCRILCIVVRTLYRLFSSLQNPGERYQRLVWSFCTSPKSKKEFET